MKTFFGEKENELDYIHKQLPFDKIHTRKKLRQRKRRVRGEISRKGIEENTEENTEEKQWRNVSNSTF